MEGGCARDEGHVSKTGMVGTTVSCVRPTLMASNEQVQQPSHVVLLESVELEASDPLIFVQAPLGSVRFEGLGLESLRVCSSFLCRDEATQQLKLHM